MRETISSAKARTSIPVLQRANSDDSKTQLSSFSLSLCFLILAASLSKQGAMDASTSSSPVNSAAACRITGLGVIFATAWLSRRGRRVRSARWIHGGFDFYAPDLGGRRDGHSCGGDCWLFPIQNSHASDCGGHFLLNSVGAWSLHCKPRQSAGHSGGPHFLAWSLLIPR